MKKKTAASNVVLAIRTVQAVLLLSAVNPRLLQTRYPSLSETFDLKGFVYLFLELPYRVFEVESQVSLPKIEKNDE